MMTVRKVRTEDGSDTLYHPEHDEIYHSRKGAISESNHVYIQAGLHALQKHDMAILELGFGTGLNALLTAIEANKLNLKVAYHGVEKYPLSENVLRDLNYTDCLGKESGAVFPALHAVSEGKTDVSPYFSLFRYRCDFNDWQCPTKVDLVYFDAFGPEVQPELWNTAVFKRVFNCMNEGGLLVTYCAKGKVQRTLKSIGFAIEKLPGPAGKREMIRAWK